MNKRYGWLLLMLCLPVFALGQDSLHTARIAFDKKDHDFKTIPQGTVAEYVFHFKNVGTDTLKIFKVKPG